MPKDSLKNLLKSFPYFFNKDVTSNFYKAQYVNNRIFQKVYQSLFEVYESFHLEKRCLIWKNQSEPYAYFINFVVNCPHLKTVQCYKNDELIYVEEYGYEDNVSSFIYIYDSTNESDSIPHILNEIDEEIEDNILGSDEDIIEEVTPTIPEDTFMIIAETYDETILQKGFPENDESMGNIFDHDVSLDEFGAQNNIPRKQYIPVNESDYAKTEPPYNNRLSEDDYHYMNRIIEYNLKLYDVPLPVLEIWKIYGLDAVMLNRERLLFKWFDETKHPLNNETGHVLDWVPEKWEHKDGFYDYDNKFGTYFFAIPSTNAPKKWTGITFRFKLLNNLAEELDTTFTVDIYQNESPLEYNWNKSEYYISEDLLDESNVNQFKFIAYADNGDVLGEENIDINVKGCNNADWYVSANGDDVTGDGSINNPFQSLTRALENVNDVENMIVVQGDVNVNDASIVNNNCTILGCGNATIHNDISNKFFYVVGNKHLTLSLIDLNLDSNGAIFYSRSSNYTNQNSDYSNYLTVLVNGGEPVLNFNIDKAGYYPKYDNVIVMGTFNSKEENPIKNSEIELSIDDTVVKTTTNNNGEFIAIVPIRNISDDAIDIVVKYNGSDTYIETELSQTINLTKSPVTVALSFGNQTTIISTGYVEGDSVSFYNEDELIDTVTANAYGEAILTFTPAFGISVVYASLDGNSVDREWLVETTLQIADLNVDYFVTDVAVSNNGDLSFEKTPLSDFNTISDLEGVILNVTVDDDCIYLNRFESNYQDESILSNDELYPLDAYELFNALIDLDIDTDSLIGVREIRE